MNAPAGGKVAAPALADFIVLNEEIAALVRARIPLESNLAQLGTELPGKSGELAERIGRRMEAGESLVAAMEAECASMPATYRAAIVAGVESGQLGSALESLVDSASRMDQLRRVTAVAMLYPLVIVVVVSWLLASLVGIVVPSFAWLDQSRYKPLTWLADWPLTTPILASVVPSLVMLAAAVWWWRSGRLGGSRRSRLGLFSVLSGSGRVHRWSQAARFSEMLLLLVERGMPLDVSLRLTAEATDDARLAGAAHRLSNEIRLGDVDIPRGRRTAAIRQSDFPVLIRLALHHAGDRALLAGSLRQAAAMYHHRAVRAADWYAEYLPILLTVAVGGAFTIGFTLFIIWPYASMLHEVSGWKWR
jgi:general secretion pathway protein F